VRHKVKYTWANGFQSEKENQGSWGTDMGYRFNETKELEVGDKGM
jgi:hypothetical protein